LLYLRDSKADKETAVMMFISFNNERTKLGTVERINPKHWDSKKQQAKQTKNFIQYPEFNTRLDKLRRTALDTYRQYLNDNEQNEPSTAHIKALITEKLKPTATNKVKSVSNLIEYTRLFIQKSKTGTRLGERGTPIKDNTLKIYNTFLKNLLEFKVTANYDLSFENINLEFYEEYKDWMMFTKQYSTNTLAKHIRTLRLIVNEAVEDRYTFVPFLGKRFKAKTEQTESVYLSSSELKEIELLDLTQNSRLDKVRDLFLVGCWTGLRFSDFSNIQAKNISEQFLKIKTQKTGREVIIPLHPVVKTIIQKYHGLTNNSLPPSLSNQKMNEYIKEVAELAGINEVITQSYTKAGKSRTKSTLKHDLITCHTARRSFASNAYTLNIPTITIMAVTGHSTESSFMKYIKITPVEHAMKIQQIWANMDAF
jgi:integrase